MKEIAFTSYLIMNVDLIFGVCLEQNYCISTFIVHP